MHSGRQADPAAVSGPGWRCPAYGLTVGCAEGLPGFSRVAPGSGSQMDLIVEVAAPAAFDAAWSGAEATIWATELPDGRSFRMERGRGGDLGFAYGDLARFHLDAEGRRLTAAPTRGRDADWQRVMMDSVLFCIRLAGGPQAIHASAVRVGSGATAIVAAAGSGKTSLASELLLQGAPLVTDDIVVIEHDGDGVAAQPGPPLMNLPFALTERLAGEVEPIAPFDQEAETWVRVKRHVDGAAALANVVLLTRGPDQTTGIARLHPNPLALLPHAVYLMDDAERARQRFALFSAAVESAALWDLRGGPDASPDVLAELVQRSML